ncbi:unnamed protein product [Gadus morhua 'NCC']
MHNADILMSEKKRKCHRFFSIHLFSFLEGGGGRYPLYCIDPIYISKSVHLSTKAVKRALFSLGLGAGLAGGGIGEGLYTANLPAGVHQQEADDPTTGSAFLPLNSFITQVLSTGRALGAGWGLRGGGKGYF